MVNLDRHLIFEARRLTTGANVHRVKEMIFAYEQAVSLHNDGWPTHKLYHSECEEALRRYVYQDRCDTFKRRMNSENDQSKRLPRVA